MCAGILEWNLELGLMYVFPVFCLYFYIETWYEYANKNRLLSDITYKSVVKSTLECSSIKIGINVVIKFLNDGGNVKFRISTLIKVMKIMCF